MKIIGSRIHSVTPQVMRENDTNNVPVVQKSLVAPTVDDDISKGYFEGYIWIHNNNYYICTNNSLGAAIWVVINATGGPVISRNFNVVLPSGSFGKYVNGDEIQSTGMTFEDFIYDVVTAYLEPTFDSFTIGFPQSIEKGTNIGGSYLSTWSTTNTTNIDLLTNIEINDITNNVLVTSVASNQTSDTIVIPSTILYSNILYRITGTNTESNEFARDYLVSSKYKVFYGSSNILPTTSSDIRALNYVFDTTNTFTLNTGNTNTIFIISMPVSKTLSSVIDLDALNANITSSYIESSIMVNDANGTPYNNKLYILEQSIPYSSNHRHVITII